MAHFEQNLSKEGRWDAAASASFRVVLAFVLIGGWANSARAESVWSRMAEAVSPNATVETPTQTAASSETAEAVSVALPAVPNEQGVALASMGSGQAFQAITGLATEGGSSFDLGLESDENQALFATDLFKKTEVRRMLGDEPRFIYDPADRPDPMLLPWVRNAAIYNELSNEAALLTENEQFEQAIALYQRIQQLGEPQYTFEANQKLTEIAMMQQGLADEVLLAFQSGVVNIELPPWINNNTNGVILSEDYDLCLVGEYVLREGDTLPNHPDVIVAAINDRQVTYRIQHESFEVELVVEEE